MWWPYKKNYEVTVGDCREVLASWPAESVHAVITSPPYFGLRAYTGDENPARAQELGRESLHDCMAWTRGEPPCAGPCFVCNLRVVAAEVWRVLRPDGCLALNLGDSYSGSPGNGRGGEGSHLDGGVPHRSAANKTGLGLKPKDLIGIPWRVAFALQADGWTLRADVIWAKGLSFCASYSGSVMPESVRDRPTRSHEYVFLLAKQAKYHYDAEAVKEQGSIPAGTLAAKASAARAGAAGVNSRPVEYAEYTGTRNLRSVWAVNPQPFPGAHYAVFPEDLVRPLVRALCPERACGACAAPWERVVVVGKLAGEGRIQDTDRPATGVRDVSPTSLLRTNGRTFRERTDYGFRPTCACEAPHVPGIVCDPFAGSGTSGRVALQEGRRFVGVELNPEYARMAAGRIENYHRREQRPKEADPQATLF